MPCSPPQRERNQHRHGVRRQAAGRGLSLHPELGRSACATDSSVYFPVRHRSVKGICTDTAAADRRSAAGSPFTRTGRSACAPDSSVQCLAHHRGVKGIGTDTASADRRPAAGSPFIPSLVVRPAQLTRVYVFLPATAAWKGSAPTRRPQTGGRPRALPSPRTWSFGLHD